MAFSPQTNALYIPMALTCERGTFGNVEKVVGKGGNGPVRRIDYKLPAGGGNLGEFLALDLKSGKVLWRQRMPTPFNPVRRIRQDAHGTGSVRIHRLEEPQHFVEIAGRYDAIGINKAQVLTAGQLGATIP